MSRHNYFHNGDFQRALLGSEKLLSEGERVQVATRRREMEGRESGAAGTQATAATKMQRRGQGRPSTGSTRRPALRCGVRTSSGGAQEACTIVTEYEAVPCLLTLTVTTVLVGSPRHT